MSSHKKPIEREQFMTNRLITATLLMLLLALPSAAQEDPLKSSYYRLKIDPRAKISERVDNGWETLMTVELEGEKAHLRWKKDEFTVIFPRSTLRVRATVTDAAGSILLTTDFAGRRYEVRENEKEIGWKLPGHDVFFRLYGGQVSGAVGTSDFLNLQKDTRGGRIAVESGVGSSDFVLRKGALELFDGPELAEHTYMVRGLAFRQGPITLEIPLPGGPFFEALPADRFLTVVNESSEGTKSEDEAAAAEVEPLGDPLRAEPSSWTSPVYRANTGNPKEDPLRARKEERKTYPTDPLRAKTGEDSEEILRVKDY